MSTTPSVRVIALLLAALALAVPPLAAQPDDSTQVVVRIHTVEPARLTALRETYDLWGIRLAEGYALARVAADQLAALRAGGLRVEIDEQETARLLAPPPLEEGAGIPGFPCYRTVEETYADLAQLALDHPTLARWIDIGDSWEKLNGPGPGYDVMALVLTNQAIDVPKAPMILIAAIHAREYTTAELATRFAELLVAGHGVDADLTWILDHHEIHIIPQLNPDGRKRAEGGLSWRKNVDNDFCTGSNSRGIDLNRNSTFFWGGSGSSGSACSTTFRGPSAASEPETALIESYMGQVLTDQRGPDLDDAAPLTAEGVFISLHSFSELVLYPWEGIAAAAPNLGELVTLGRKFGFHNQYSVCDDCLGVAAGTTVDIAYGEYGVAGYTFELGTSFFQSCTAFENTILPANLPALVYAAKAVRRPYQTPSGPEVIALMPAIVQITAGDTVDVAATADDTRYDSGGFGNEPTQAIAAAYVSIDTPPWQTVTPQTLAATDGLFDETVEAIAGTVDTGALAAGRHILYVYAEDAAGNLGAPTALFVDVVDPGAIFRDGFDTGTTAAWALTAGE